MSGKSLVESDYNGENKEMDDTRDKNKPIREIIGQLLYVALDTTWLTNDDKNYLVYCTNN